jgi:RimJ/RimL family protein N-acetyltransferase
MIELVKKDYAQAGPLFRDLEWNLITRAVLEGTSPGRIYVDRVEDPRTAFLCSVEGYYLAGDDSNDAFNRSLNRLILRQLFAGDTVRRGETDVAISVHPDSWKEKMPVIFRGRGALLTARRHYVCTARPYAWQDRVPDGVQVHRLDEELLRTPAVEVPEHVIKWMTTNWGSVEEFLRRGFGVCTLRDRRVVSWSVADCVSGEACEIGIHTADEYRRRGLATLTAVAAVDYALSHGLRQVGWHCDEYNVGSIRVAENAGFTLERKYVQYYACANEAHHLEETAAAHFRATRYREAIDSYDRFFATPLDQLPQWLREILPQELGVHYFRVAFAHATLGKEASALEYLDKAVDHGWLHADYLMGCQAFASLHDTPRWNHILKKIQTKRGTP